MRILPRPPFHKGPFLLRSTFLAVGLPPTQGFRTIKQSALQLKQAQQLELDAVLRGVLARAKKIERAADIGAIKRKDNNFLSRYLEISMNSPAVIRSVDGFRSRSYNESKQALALIDHLFVRYRVPLFLYRAVLSCKGLHLVFGGHHGAKDLPDLMYRRWFLAVARGESFAKASRGFFTKREAHWFLLAPEGNDLEQNVLWARAAASGIPRAGCDYLVHRLDKAFLKDVGDRLPDLLAFYALAWPEMRGYDRDEITDFIRAIVRNASFSFKGRTFGSMRKRCVEWHRTVYSGRVGHYHSWSSLLNQWEFRKGGVLVRAEELTNNRQLSEEGRSQRHCVGTYAGLCASGKCLIVSLRWYISVGGATDELIQHLDRRLTMEVRLADRTVVQIRGRCNQRAAIEEMKAVRHWAGEQGLRIAQNA